MRVRFAPRAHLIIFMDNLTHTNKPKSVVNVVLIIFALVFILFGAIGQFANFMHRSKIKEFEEKGKIYSGTVTDNYFFYSQNIGQKTTTKTNYMICFKPEAFAPEGYDLLCSSEYVSRSLAKQLPVGTKIDGYWRGDIYEVLLVPAINTWRNSWFFQYAAYVFLGLGIVLFAIAKIMKRLRS